MAPFILGTWLLLTFFNLYGIEYVSDGLTVEKTFSQELVQKAENGDPEAQYHLGACYDGGSGVGRDMAKAVEWYKKAAAQGFLKAQFRLGHIYECSACACAKQDCQKCPVKVDMPKSFQWRREAAEGGMVEAQILLGKRLSEYGSFRDDEEARIWLKKAALNGSEEAEQILKTVPSYGRKPFSADLVVKAESGSSEDQLSLGRCYLYGEGVAKDIDLAIKWLKKAAENNSYIGNTKIDAQLLLANIYEKDSKKYNAQEALYWNRAAAESGDIPSKIKTAEILLINKKISDASKKEAEQYLLDACTSGNPEADLKLAEFYLDYDEKKKQLALPLLYQAAGKGVGRAAYLIGLIFKEGKITEKNSKKALEWFLNAKRLGYSSVQDEIDAYQKNPTRPELSNDLIQKANSGDKESELALGQIYYYGEGIRPDYYEAEKWLRRAADKNDAKACRYLGELHSRDLLIEDQLYSIASNHGIENAKPWLQESAANENEDAAKLLGILLILYPLNDENYKIVEAPRKMLDPLAKKGDLQAIQALQILRSRWPYPYSKELLEEVKQEVPEAFFDLGYAYMYGEGVQKDPQKAVENFQKSFEKGNLWSAQKLYQLYKNVIKNEQEAEKWEKKMAATKNRSAAKEMEKDKDTLIKIKTEIVDAQSDKIFAESPDLLEKAAKGNSDAQLALGIYRYEGYLIKNQKSIKWYKQAVQNGDAESAFRIGMAYVSGDLGLKKDFGQAESYLIKASNQNHPESQAKLGIMYFEGKNMSKKPKEGMELLLRASKNGNYEAKAFLEAQATK